MTVWKEVESKGCKWLVSSDGNVKTPAHEGTYNRTRGGKVQTLSSSFPERVLTPCVTKGGYFEVRALQNSASCTTRSGTQCGLHHNVSEALFSTASSVTA